MVSINQTVTFCVNETTACAGSYSWSLAGGTATGQSTSANTECYTFTPTQATTYMLTATCNYGGTCTVAQTANIVVDDFCVGKADGTSCGTGAECCAQMCVMVPVFTIEQQ